MDNSEDNLNDNVSDASVDDTVLTDEAIILMRKNFPEDSGIRTCMTRGSYLRPCILSYIVMVYS